MEANPNIIENVLMNAFLIILSMTQLQFFLRNFSVFGESLITIARMISDIKLYVLFYVVIVVAYSLLY
jgi:hypothetical protein